MMLPATPTLENPDFDWRPQASSSSVSVSKTDGTDCAYVARLARTPADLKAAQTLRFEVFNLELHEGLASSYATGLDADPFDEVCDHLIVEERQSGEVVGTYRLQTGLRALLHRGYYNAQEFDLAPFAPRHTEILELGRACVARAHRKLAVLQLLWRGIAVYAQAHGTRYLLGCSSVHASDPRVGASLYSDLMRTHLVSPEWQVRPLWWCACPLNELATESAKIPKLLAAYLALGARICGPPALDREFRTIDFLTLLDLQRLSPRAAVRYLAPSFASPADLKTAA